MSIDQIVLVQISDPHCAAEILNSTFSWVPGQSGHDVLLMDALALAMDDVWTHFGLRSRDDLYLVMSGDLSRFGLPEEFATGVALFHGFLPSPGTHPSMGIGTGLSMQRLLLIPGNHDHWGGRPRLLINYGAHNPRIYGSLSTPRAPFEPLPWRFRMTSTMQGFRLHLYGLDSNSGLEGKTHNVRAGGCINPAEIARLHRMILDEQPSNQRVLRAITLHHPVTRDWHEPLLGPLDRPSWKLLHPLIAKHGITALLTGHTHRTCHERYGPGREMRRFACWEHRAPTVLQGPAALGKQGFLVHRLTNEKGSPYISWLTEEYTWDGTRFMLVTGLPRIEEEY